MSTEKVISVRKLRAGSLFKLLLLGLLVSCVALGIIFGVAALFGANTVTWNNHHLHGIVGLVVSPFLAAAMALIFTASVGSLAAIGLWVLSFWRPVSLRVVIMEDYANEA